MSIALNAYANDEGVFLAWSPAAWDAAWIGFAVERRDKAGTVTTLTNRIPADPNGGPVPPGGISSALSPIRRCIWTDYAVTAPGTAYRVTPMVPAPGGKGLQAVASAASAWTTAAPRSGDSGGGCAVFFNRGTLMSQVVSRFVGGAPTTDALRAFTATLPTPGTPGRTYLSGQARTAILAFLSGANTRGSTVHAALYEVNDPELVDALKPLGARGHVLLGNGDATDPTVAPALQAAGLEVRHRDLSHRGASSPSVHNKFVVETDKAGHPVRVLTGSTNWTTTGLCTQLNNVLVLDRPAVAVRFRDQWTRLAAAGDDLPPALVQHNTVPTTDRNVQVFFAATKGEAEFKPVLDLIAGAKHGVLSLMFMPGNSPLLQAILARAQEDKIYVRGVVSSVNTTGTEVASVGSQVIRTGQAPAAFHDDVILPSGVPQKNKPAWAEAEFTVGQIKSSHMIAIVHSKVIVVDPFSPDCAVVTGSHNFSDSASAHNDENLVVIRGNQALAQAYAIHIGAVYDSYSWRAFLNGGGNPAELYRPMAAWQPGGARSRDLRFWMGT